MHRAASCQDLHICELGKYYSCNLEINSKNHLSVTPLHYAAIFGSEACIPLLTFGADINSTTKAGLTPLQKAAMNGNYNVCRILCENKKIDVNWQVNSSNDETALHQAVFYRSQHYDDPNDPYTPKVCDDEYTLIVKLLLKRGANANLQNGSGDTVLHVAARQEMNYITKQLLNYNANIHIKNNANKTALDLARKNKYKHVQKLIIQNGVKSKSKSQYFFSVNIFVKYFLKLNLFPMFG